MGDGTVAGYGLFGAGVERPELLLHPSDRRTGLKYSLLPMTQSIIGNPASGATPSRAHPRAWHFPDGVRLIDRPVAYHGGPQTVFQRAESSSFFGREIGLMYVHAHLRYAESMAILGDAEALWNALQLASPVTVTERLAHACPRQRNAYFSSSDAAFADRYAASAEWWRVNSAEIGFEEGWRIYSSGPGIFISLLVRHLLGHRRLWGEHVVQPLLPTALRDMVMDSKSSA